MAFHRRAIIPVTPTSRWKSLSDYLKINLVVIYFMGSLLLQSMISWVGHFWNERHGNTHFFLYVCTTLLKDLYAKCCWCRKEPSKGNQSADSMHQPLPTRTYTSETSSLPELDIQRTWDEPNKGARNVTKDEEWFLSSKSVPNTTEAERKRFLRARKGDVKAASAMLQHYLDWRAQFDQVEHHEPRPSENKSDTIEEDPIWSKACVLASSISPSSSLSLSGPKPPCIVFFPDKDGSMSRASETLRTVKGNRVLQHLPARIDLSAAEAEEYATALALYIDLQLPRDSMEKICVVIDVRPGAGWCNIPAPTLVPFIKHAARLLNVLHPERLDSCILFPVPVIATFLWSAVSPFLDPATASKVCILSGSANVNSPVPKDIQLHLQKDVVEWMERKRLSTFGTVASRKQ